VNGHLVLAHARALLTRGRTAYIQADLRDPESILASPVLPEVLDLSRARPPAAVAQVTGRA
jgi:hypothetical protein